MSRNVKDEELHYLNSFKNCFDNFPNGIINLTESPDFIIDSDDFLLGVEITKIEIEKLVAKESLEGKIKFALLNKLHESKISNLVIYLLFYRDFKLRNVQIKDLVDEIFKIIMINQPDIDSIFRLNDLENGEPILKKYVNIIQSILIYNNQDSKEPYVGIPSFSWIQSPIEYIKKRIKIKEVKISNYRKKANKIWLILVVVGNQPSSSFKFDNEIYSYEFETSFDNIYIFEIIHSKIIELKTIQP